MFLDELWIGRVLSRRVLSSSAASGNNLKVFRIDFSGIAGRSVIFRPQADQFTAQDLLPACVQSREGTGHGTVNGPEKFPPRIRAGRIFKGIQGPPELQAGNSVGEAV